jgi:hypothetical protein
VFGAVYVFKKKCLTGFISVAYNGYMNTNTTMNNADFCRVITILMNEYERCMDIQLAKGYSRDEAAKIVGQQADEWLATRN